MTTETLAPLGFNNLNLAGFIKSAIEEMNFTEPSAIQREAIPHILKGIDIIAQAPTGSGKTATFAIPILHKLDLNPENTTVQALILCPTRELTMQVQREFEKLKQFEENIRVVSIYGGQPIDRQLGVLKKNPQIIVATPGRLMDHLRRGSIKLDALKTIVLDEADEMLDMGFREDINTILEDTPVERQTILFSATMAKDIIELTKKFQKSPLIVDVTDNLLNAPNIEQFYFEVVEKDKPELITRLLSLHNIKLALIFSNTKSNVDKLVQNLKILGYLSEALHGDMNQSQREKVMEGFRKGHIKILVATDVAGRGIDVANVEAVFNYDLPRDDEDYIHRIGRTARAGNSGVAFTFVTKRQVGALKRIERANGIKITEQQRPSVEKLDEVRLENYAKELSEIIKTKDLTSYKDKINSLVDNETPLIDIAGALFSLITHKERKKINAKLVFEEVPNETPKSPFGGRRNFGDKGGFRGSKSGGGKNGGGSNRNKKDDYKANKGRFSSKKPKKG